VPKRKSDVRKKPFRHPPDCEGNLRWVESEHCSGFFVFGEFAGPVLMTSFRFQCPLCAASLKVPRDLSGTISACPSCRQSVRVPDLSADPVLSPFSSFDSVASSVVKRSRGRSVGLFRSGPSSLIAVGIGLRSFAYLTLLLFLGGLAFVAVMASFSGQSLLAVGGLVVFLYVLPSIVLGVLVLFWMAEILFWMARIESRVSL